MSDSPGRIDVPLSLLRCPACRAELQLDGDSLVCSCAARYPIIDGVPVLIDDNRSVFSVDSFKRRSDTFFVKPSRLRRIVFSLLPELSRNRVGIANYSRLSCLLLERAERPLVLVLGGSILGAGMEKFRADSRIEFLDTDVAFGPLTRLICDGHQLPFPPEAFDGVVATAVLEHVVDPEQCVAEIHRVLKPGGLVYTEIPFLQPAHATPYDFRRFTFIGYRWLFRAYEQLALGPAGGPGEVLARSYEQALLCVGSSRAAHAIAYVFARCTAFWLKYLDTVLARNPHAIHCSSGLFFLGKKSSHCCTASEVIERMRGL